jgi:fibronectin type 3 domain-containing protein
MLATRSIPSKTTTRTSRILPFVVAALLTLAGCGGGGSGDGGGGGFGSISLSARADSATRISLSWSQPSGGVSVSPYAVARNDSGSTSNIGSTTERTYVVAGLSPNTEYCFLIRNPITGNGMSNTACVTTPADSSAPTVPSGLSAVTESSGSIGLSWAGSSDDDRVDGYNIFRDGVLLRSSQPIVFTDNTADPGTRYCYTVTAFDSAGNESTASAESCATTPADTEDPTVPTDVTATFSDSNGQPDVSVAWAASTDDGVVRYYKVYRNNVYVADAADTVYEDADLQPDTGYCYTISAVDAAAKESAQSEAACARESWRKVALDATYAPESAIALDSSDTPHIAYKVQQFDSTSGEYRFRLRYLKLQSGITPSSDILQDGLNTFWFSDAYRIAIAVDSNDSVHLAHKVNKVLQPEEVQYIQLSSGSTLKSTVQQSSERMGSISLAIDSDGSLRSCYSLGSKLYYASNASGAWVTVDVDSLVAGVAGSACSIAVDSDSAVHISFLQGSSNNLQYLSNKSGSWAVETLDIHSGSPVNTSHHTSIKADSLGNAHIAYFHDYADNDLEYATNESGNWVSSKIDSEGNVGFDCEIAIDANNFAHIIYKDLTNSALLKYANNRSGAWDAGVLSAAGVSNTSIAIDSLGKVHVTFADADERLTYLTNRD